MLNCAIVSPKKTIIYKKLQSVTLPGVSGEMQILPDHAESFILLKEGDIILQKSKNVKENIQILEGICYVKSNSVNIIL